MHFDPQEFERRWDRTQRAMHESGIDALLVGDKHNYWYFTGHLTREIEKKRPMLFLLPRSGLPTLIIYSLAERAARKSVPSARILTYEDLPFPTHLVEEALREASLVSGRLGMELGPNERMGLSHQELEQAVGALPSVWRVDAGPLLQHLRMIKSEEEVGAIRRACALSLRAWDAVVSELRVGLTNVEIKKLIATELARAGSDFDVAGHISVGDGVAGLDGYRPGEVLWADFGGTYCGYQADIARRVAFQAPAPAQSSAQEMVSTVFAQQLAAIRPGVRCSDVARACNDGLESLGLPRLGPKKRVGHGLGLGAGEPPSLSETDDSVLQPGMVVTPEPRFSLPTGEKVHIEEVVVVVEDGCERLTHGAEELGIAGLPSGGR